MIFYRRFVSLFGVALCAAPMLILFVPTTLAQTGNNQSQMLFEMQAMKQEIAELRDMVERQAYRLRQLQNASSQQNTNSQQRANNQIGTQAPSSDVNSTSASNNSTYQQPSPSTEYQVPAGDFFPGGTQSTSVPVSSQTDPQYNSQPEYVSESNSSSLPPVQEPLGTGEYTLSTEERPISRTQNTLPDTYPPVEERTIESSQTGRQVSVYDPETYNQEPYSQGTAVVTERDYNQQVGTVSDPNVPNQQVGTVSDSNFPTPYQRDTPARQPVVNNIPASPAPGGIVSIPQAESSQPVAVSNDTSIQSPTTTSLGEQTYYQQGFELLKQSKHDEAVSTFKKQIADYPSGEYSDDAHYWIAESLYVNRNLDESKLYFKAIIDKFAQSPRLPDAMLKTAYIEQEQGNKIEARILLQEIIQFHPRSNAAISAKNRLADLD